MADATHEQLLSELVDHIKTKALPYYEGASARNYWLWHICATLILVISIATALVAALANAKNFESGWRAVLIGLPILGSGLSGLMQLFQFREKEALREAGRIEIEDILLNARSLMIASKSEEEFKSAFHAVRERYKAHELSQHRGDVALRSDDILQRAEEGLKLKGQPSRKRATSSP